MFMAYKITFCNGRNWWKMFTIIERPCWFTIIEKPGLLMMVHDGSAVKCCLGRNKLLWKELQFHFYQGTKMSSHLYWLELPPFPFPLMLLFYAEIVFPYAVKSLVFPSFNIKKYFM